MIRVPVGSYMIHASDTGQPTGELASLEIRPRSTDDDETGQWFLRIREPQKNLESWQVFLALYGLAPIGFSPGFVARLQSEQPLALLFDTNALRHGAVLAALRARGGRSLYAAFSDQTYMEIQTLRERSLGTSQPLKAASKARMEGYLIPRAFERLRQQGYALHEVRPPDALVRYFGHSGGAQEQNADRPGSAPGFYRDRMILESLRHLRTQLQMTGMDPILVTHDQNLFSQARMEHFQSEMFRAPGLQENTLITSPFLDAYQITIHHLPVEQFLTELLLWKGQLCLTSDETNTHLHLSLHKKREQVTLGLAGEGDFFTVRQQPSIPAASPTQSPPPTPPNPDPPPESVHPEPTLPARPPTAENLLGCLLGKDSPTKETIPFLVALGWADAAGVPTTHAQTLCQRWAVLAQTPDPIEQALGWCAWMRALAQDLAKLPFVQSLLRALHGKGAFSQEALAASLQLGKTALEFQLRLAVQLGALGGSSALGYVAPSGVELSETIKRVFHSLADVHGGVLTAVELWEQITSNYPCALHELRETILNLYREGRIVPIGDIPGKSSAHKFTVFDFEAGANLDMVKKRVDLNRDEFLIPGKAAYSLRWAYTSIPDQELV